MKDTKDAPTGSPANDATTPTAASASSSPDTCPECGIDFATGRIPPKDEPVDRKGHALMHWGTDDPKSLDNPEARKRAEQVLGSAGDAKKEG